MPKHQTESRNASVRNLVKQDGEKETKEFIRQHYGIPSYIDDWKELDDMAESIQKERNQQAR